MRKRDLFLSGGAVALGISLIALPGTSAAPQDSADAKMAQLEQRIEELQARLAERLAAEQQRVAEFDQDREAQSTMRTAYQEVQEQERGQQQEMERTPRADGPDTMIFMGDEGASWLGVESQEVTSDTVKELKLPAERGVLLGRIVPDSPAAKAGLKDNDVITEINGQRVEGEAQFRRMIHEIPAGRTAQFTIWRDSRAQSINVTLGKSEERGNMWFKTAPRAFAFQLPKVEIPEMPDVPEAPGMGWNFGVLAGARPRLGIDAEDLSGQLGAYFGAPDGEGVLVRDVNAGSAAAKAGVKSGDVITSLDGDRIRSLGDLREKLADKREAKTVKLGVLRNKSEMSLTVDMPPLPSRTRRTISRRTNI